MPEYIPFTLISIPRLQSAVALTSPNTPEWNFLRLYFFSKYNFALLGLWNHGNHRSYGANEHQQWVYRAQNRHANLFAVQKKIWLLVRSGGVDVPLLKFIDRWAIRTPAMSFACQKNLPSKSSQPPPPPPRTGTPLPTQNHWYHGQSRHSLWCDVDVWSS